MNTSAAEQSPVFGQPTLPVVFGLQLEAFESLQKLAQLNLSAMKATLDEAQGALSSSEQSASSPFAASAGLPQQWLNRGLAYTQHVQEIESKFQGAAIQASQVLYDQCNAMWAQFSGNLGSGEPFSSNAMTSAMQPAIAAAINRSLGTMQESFRYAGGASSGERSNVAAEA